MTAKEHVHQLDCAIKVFELLTPLSRQPEETEAHKNIASIRWALTCLRKADRLCVELQSPAMEYLAPEIQNAWSSLANDLGIPKTLAELETYKGL